MHAGYCLPSARTLSLCFRLPHSEDNSPKQETSGVAGLYLLVSFLASFFLAQLAKRLSRLGTTHTATPPWDRHLLPAWPAGSMPAMPH